MTRDYLDYYKKKQVYDEAVIKHNTLHKTAYKADGTLYFR